MHKKAYDKHPINDTRFAFLLCDIRMIFYVLRKRTDSNPHIAF
jgi:hypothetical protein